jgi:hypothetical protein
MADAATKDRFAQAAEQTAAAERAIQDNIDRKDEAKPKQETSRARCRPARAAIPSRRCLRSI